MRIAFLNRGRETHPGGDLVQLDETMAALRRLGVECEETGWDAERIASGNFDLCHVFHCSFDWSLENVRAVKRAGKKYVLTPIYYPDLYGINNDDLKWIVAKAEAILPFSKQESIELHQRAWLHRCPVTIIPNGTSRDFHFSEHRVSHGVLTVCARPDDKNADKVRMTCERSGILYANANGIDRKNMPGEYYDARVFVNASESERMSLTIGEALCAGCRVLATKENRGNEWYGPGLYTFDPKESVEVLAERIRTAYECSDDDWDWSPNIKARKLTWDLTAAMLKQVYEEVLAQ